jgi:hypothetical protein
MEVTPDIFPFAAWEQAVFVVLFLIMIGLLLRWFTKQQREWQDFIERQNNRWQEAVKGQDRTWQEWLMEQNNRECVTMDKVTESLDRLTIRLAEHDERSAGRFLEAIELARGLSQGPQKQQPGANPGPRKRS